MTVSLSLTVIGSDDAPRWAVRVATEGADRYCCEGGHDTPEDAAAHGSLLATAILGRYARNLEPPAFGAVILTAA